MYFDLNLILLYLVLFIDCTEQAVLILGSTDFLGNPLGERGLLSTFDISLQSTSAQKFIGVHLCKSLLSTFVQTFIKYICIGVYWVYLYKVYWVHYGRALCTSMEQFICTRVNWIYLCSTILALHTYIYLSIFISLSLSIHKSI